MMSPDPNANDIPPSPVDVATRMNGNHKEGAVPEEVLGTNGLSLHSLQRLAKTGGSAEEVPTEIVSPKAACGEHSEDEEEIEEYLQRSDTAVIYPEPVEQLVQGKVFFCTSVNLVSTLTHALLRVDATRILRNFDAFFTFCGSRSTLVI